MYEQLDLKYTFLIDIMPKAMTGTGKRKLSWLEQNVCIVEALKQCLTSFHYFRKNMPPTLEGQITIEKTPSYFVMREVPQRVYQMNPAMKLLVVVRDPVTRAISDYTQVVR